MKPDSIGDAYNQITDLWESTSFDRLNGIAQHKKAIAFSKNRGKALDVGCGSTGRIIDLLLESGFDPEGIDISERMIKLARERHPEVKFSFVDACTWESPDSYDFISAWDSLWHVRLDQQRNLLTMLVNNLKKDGVLIISCGGTDGANEHRDSAMGPELYYASLGLTGYLELFFELACTCRHLEYDQYPELHTYLIIQKN